MTEKIFDKLYIIMDKIEQNPFTAMIVLVIIAFTIGRSIGGCQK